MACRIGISKYPNSRIKHWKDKEGHTYSKILAEKLTYKQASELEKKEAIARACTSHLGGDPGDDRYKHVWSVYYVSGGTIS